MIPASRCAWLLLAAGQSRRFGAPQSKLLSPLGERRVIDVTLASLESALPGARILLVSTPGLRDTIGYRGDWAEGGARRQDSARNGILASGDADAVLIHDAARPFVSPRLVASLLAALDGCDGCAPGTPVTDTIKRVEKGRIVETLERDALAAVQTPQVLACAAARDAFTRVDFSVEYTDDLAVLATAGYRTAVVPGDKRNLKITTPDDMLLAERLLASWPADGKGETA